MWYCPSMHIQKRQHFYAQTTSAKLYVCIGVEARDLYIDKAHTALDILRFTVFLDTIPDLCQYAQSLALI